MRCSLCVLASLLACQNGLSQLTVASEYQLKASFLSNFPTFIEWPADAFPSANSPFNVCVYGDFYFGTSLAELTGKATVQNRKVAVRWIKKEADLAACQIVYVSRLSQKQYARVFGVLQSKRVLTVGENTDFLTAGGGVAFFLADEKLQFEVNLASTREAHLKVSAPLLSLARRVWGTNLEVETR